MIEKEVERGTFMARQETPAFSEVAKNWIKKKELNLRSSTWAVYDGHINNHFTEFTNVAINRIDTAQVEKWITARQQQGMNILTIRKILVTLGQIFSYAVRHKYIESNPLRDAERPRGMGVEMNTTIKILAPDKIKKLIEAETDQKYRMIYLLAIMTGARQGELLGLKWSDIDWENKQIHIQRTFNNGAWYDTKTSTSNRMVDIGKATISELKKWKLACPKNKLNMVFPNEVGEPIDHHNLVKRHFKPALNAANEVLEKDNLPKIPQIRFHDLRHTYASLLIEQGENIKYIQTQLGHSSPTVTLNVYAHLMNQFNHDVACRLEKKLGF
jgi:integrase